MGVERQGGRDGFSETADTYEHATLRLARKAEAEAAVMLRFRLRLASGGGAALHWRC